MIHFYPDINSESIPNGSTVIYGGSFSPMTVGHMKMVTDIMERLPKCKFFIVPVNDIYPKKIIRGTDEVGSFHRLVMCQFMVDHIRDSYPDTDISVCDWTFTQPNPYIDKEIMDHFQELYPDTHLCYLCGLDVYESLPTWKPKDRDAILNEQFSLIVHPRNNEISSTRLKQIYKETGTIIDTIPSIEEYLRKHQLLEPII